MTDSAAPRVVLAAGIPRSGSTWAYNAARLLLEREAPGGVYGAWVDNYTPGRPEPTHLVKIHNANEEWARRADAIITSRRDMRRIVASTIRMGWLAPDADAVAPWVERVVGDHAFWAARADVEIVYEDMMRDPAAPLERVAAALGVSGAGLDAIAAQLASMTGPPGDPDGGWSVSDPLTLLLKGHRAETAELSPELAAVVETHARDWLVRCGYSV